MSNGKQTRRSKKKEELPSFLLGLTAPPEDISLSSKPKASLQYLGPIFFGKCSGYPHHAPPHSLKLGSFHHPQHGMLPASDDITKLLLPQAKAEKEIRVMKPFRPKIKRQKVFQDLYPHKCLGRQKMFVPEITPHVIDLGKTQSIIEGEATIEMPFCRVCPRGYKRKSGSRPEVVELTTFSDIREKNRMYMPYKERIAHAHFPKEFTTVRIIGPTIPASITITKLPTKRKTQSELTLELKAKADAAEAEKETEEKKDEIQEIEPPPADSEYQEEELEMFGDEENLEEEIERGSSRSTSEGGQMDEQEEEREREEGEEEEGEKGDQTEEFEEEEGEEGEVQEEEVQTEEGQNEEDQEEETQREESQMEEGQTEEDQTEEGETEEDQTEEGQREEDQTEEGQEEGKKEEGQEEGQKEEGQEEGQTEEGQKDGQNAEGGEGTNATQEVMDVEETEMFESEEENA